MIILGGALLLAPGFITDVIGFALLIPPTRAVFRGVVARLARRRVVVRLDDAASRGPRPRRRHRAGGTRPRPARGYDYEGSAREVDDQTAELDARRATRE